MDNNNNKLKLEIDELERNLEKKFDNLKQENNELKLDIDNLKEENINTYRIDIQNIPIINIKNKKQTINFNTNIKELDLSNIDIDEGTINWQKLNKFYNLKIIIVNYKFNANFAHSNLKFLQTSIIIFRDNYTDGIQWDSNIHNLLKGNI